LRHHHSHFKAAGFAAFCRGMPRSAADDQKKGSNVLARISLSRRRESSWNVADCKTAAAPVKRGTDVLAAQVAARE
jgi:hypothetical protein